jgi:hypothetical protein
MTFQALKMAGRTHKEYFRAAGNLLTLVLALHF